VHFLLANVAGQRDAHGVDSLQLLVYAGYGRELMGCKSPVCESYQ